jgi:hypothetical protein
MPYTFQGTSPGYCSYCISALKLKQKDQLNTTTGIVNTSFEPFTAVILLAIFNGTFVSNLIYEDHLVKGRFIGLRDYHDVIFLFYQHT